MNRLRILVALAMIACVSVARAETLYVAERMLVALRAEASDTAPTVETVETGAPLAGEMSGHTFFKERWYGFDDGLYTAARLLELLSHDSRKPAEIFHALPNTVNTPELNLKFAEGDHYTFMQKLLDMASFPDARITTIDGLRADFADGFPGLRSVQRTCCQNAQSTGVGYRRHHFRYTDPAHAGEENGILDATHLRNRCLHSRPPFLIIWSVIARL